MERKTVNSTRFAEFNSIELGKPFANFDWPEVGNGCRVHFMVKDCYSEVGDSFADFTTIHMNSNTKELLFI